MDEAIWKSEFSTRPAFLFTIIFIAIVVAVAIFTLPKQELSEDALQNTIDSLKIELDSCLRRNAKMEKDFNTCYTYKNRAWANNLQSK